MDAALDLSVSEAGFVLDQSASALHRAIDRGEVASAGTRRLGHAELRYLKLAATFSQDLTPNGRKRLFSMIKALPATQRVLSVGPIVVDLDWIDAALDPRLDRLRMLRAGVERSENGDVLLEGTKIPVFAIAGLSRGQTIPEILEDYPSLDLRQVQLALDYARAYPKTGRPFPARSLKRHLSKAAEAGVFDVPRDDDPVSPDDFG